MSFGMRKKAENLLSIDRMRDLWIGNIDGQISAIISIQQPTEGFEVSATHVLEVPLTQEELGYLRAKVRYALSSRIGYSLSTGSIEQRTKDIGSSVVEFSIVLTPITEDSTWIIRPDIGNTR